MTTDADTDTATMHSISLANSLLMQNLLWFLISEGVLSKEKISEMIAGCKNALNGAPNPTVA